MPQFNLYLQDISQAYVEFTTHLNRKFFVHGTIKLGLPSDAILKIIKSLYGVPEMRNYWFNTYNSYHCKKFLITRSIYDPCLFYTKNSRSGFAIVGLQTDNTLFLGDETFAIKEKKQLNQANLFAKKREKLGNKI